MANTVAYGFLGMERLFNEKLEDVNVQVVLDAIRDSVTEHQRQVTEMNGEMFNITDQYSKRFLQPGSGTLQPLDEWGNPLPTRPQGFYDVGFPIQGGGDAYGANRVSRAYMTVADVNRNILDILSRDSDWVKRHMLAAIFDNTTWTYGDPQHGDLTIQPLANGDSVQYVKRSGIVATDNHYTAQAAAIADGTNPFGGIYDNLNEHPVNSNATIVSYIPTNVKDDVEGLAAFTEVGDPDVLQGANADTIVGRVGRGWGDEVLGKVNKVWIIEAGILPDNYLVNAARGGSAPLWMREHVPAELKGLIQEQHSPDGNVLANRFIRYAGFGAHNRVGASVHFVNAGDTTYDIPAGYNTPLPR